MKRAMDASEMNLTDFFKKMGLLREINMKVGDYGPAKQITITKEMVGEIENYGKSKSPVPTPVIYYISGNSLDTYKKTAFCTRSFQSGEYLMVIFRKLFLIRCGKTSLHLKRMPVTNWLKYVL